MLLWRPLCGAEGLARVATQRCFAGRVNEEAGVESGVVEISRFGKTHELCKLGQGAA